jgi:succinate dehydrogenase / fumarate reductase iron-sulfur subunit
MVDRNAFDKIIQAGGYTTIRTGQAQDANAILIPKEDADEAMDCASCIGCGACVAACKNGSAMLFVSSKVSQLALLPQGRVEAARRVKNMIAKMDELGFGNCTSFQQPRGCNRLTDCFWWVSLAVFASQAT